MSSMTVHGNHLGVPELALSEKKIDRSFAEKVSRIAYERFWVPVSIGMKVGVLDLICGISLATILEQIPGLASSLVDPAAAEEFLDGIDNFWETAVLAPVVEEIIFRGILYGFLRDVMEALLPDYDVPIFSFTVKLAALVAIVATAILFGWVHIANGIGVIHAILAGTTGVVYGILREKHGLISSTAAHMTNNALVVAAMKLSKV